MWATTLHEHGNTVLQWGAVLGAALVGAIWDARTRRIPNALTAPLLLGGLAHAVVVGGWAGLADSAAATLAFLNLPEGATTSTIEAKTNFLAAVRAGVVTARAELVHRGRTTIVVQTDVTDDTGRLVSRTLQTQAVIEGRDGG